ncbi:MAG: phosphoglucosamine mutase [Bryobacteraceae bacterium]|nr:phosphoglucosamine mutase [Bryobacteraceae bacterium]
MARQLFGTDGIRGVAGKYPLDPRTVFAFGRALGEWAGAAAGKRAGESARIVIGMDTRESGPGLASLVAAGLRRSGTEPVFAGLTTTPGVAYVTRVEDFIAGLVISASHNPYHDNGLKVFDHSGFKLADEIEDGIERRIFAFAAEDCEPSSVALEPDSTLDKHYIDFLASTYHHSLAGRRIVLDCANGSASYLGPELFARLGAQVISTSCAPDGRNINLNCGALHTEALRAAVLDQGADYGAAFDGDADRCMIVSGSGKLIDGDHAMLIAGRKLHAEGRLAGKNGKAAVVATVMSNLGLQRALESDGIELIRTNVGDKYVLEEMLRSDLPLGGEQSGHVIFREFATTGDGLLTALRVIERAEETGRSLDELTADFHIYPQRLVNVRFKVKRPLEELPVVQSEIQATEAEFGAAGRVLVRFSGTEPLARVMVEGPSEERVLDRAQRIAAAIGAALSE